MSKVCLNPESAEVIALVESSKENFPKFTESQIRAVGSLYQSKTGNFPTPEDLLDFYATLVPQTEKQAFNKTEITEKEDILDLLQSIFFKGLERLANGKSLTSEFIKANQDRVLKAIPGLLESAGLTNILENYPLYQELLVKTNLRNLNVQIDTDLDIIENQESKDNNWDKDSTLTSDYTRATDEIVYLFAGLESDEEIAGIPRSLPISYTWDRISNLLAGTSDLNSQVDILRHNLDKYPFIYQILNKLGYGDFQELGELQYSSIRTSFQGAFSKNKNGLVVTNPGKFSIDNIESTTMLSLKEKWKSNFRASDYSKIVGDKRVFNPEKIDELLEEPDNQEFLAKLGIFLHNYDKVTPMVASIKKYFLQKIKTDNNYSWLDDGKFVSSALSDLLKYELEFIKETKATGARNAKGEYQYSIGLHSFLSKVIGNLQNKLVKYTNAFEKLFYDNVATLAISQGVKANNKAKSFDQLSIGDIYTSMISDMFSPKPFIHLPRTADKKTERGIQLTFDKFTNSNISYKDYYDTIMAYTKISPALYSRLYEQYSKDYVKENNPKWTSKDQKPPVDFWNQMLNIDKIQKLTLAEFKQGIDNYIDQQVPELFKELEKHGVISYDRHGNMHTTFSNSFLEGESKYPNTDKVNALLKNYIFNSLMYGTEITQMKLGSLTTQNPEDFFKRTAGPVGEGKIPRTDAAIVNMLQAQRAENMKEFPSPSLIRIMISKDNIASSTNAKEYNEAGNTKSYSENNVDDAQGNMIFQSYREWKKMLNEWSSEQETAWKQLEKGKKLTNKEFFRLFPPIKPVGYALVNINGYPTPVYIKTSIYPMHPTLVKGTMNELAYNKMMEKGISINLPQSAMKVGYPKNLKDRFVDGNYEINDDAIFEFPTENFLSQLDIAVKDSLKQLIGTQQQKLIAVNMYNNGGVVDKDFENWVEERKQTLEKLSEIETKNLEEKAGIEMKDGIPTITNYTKLQQMLRDELLSRDTPLNTIEAVNELVDENGNLLSTIDTLPSRQKLMNLLNSIVTNKLIKLYTNGSALVQVAQTGWEMIPTEKGNKATDQEILDIDCAIDFVNNAAKIAYYRNKGLQFLTLGKNNGAAEILLPAKFKKYVDSEGNIDPRLLVNIGYRIPTQGLNSILHLKVVGFLAPGLDQMVVMPKEITTQGGSDFDVDKLNIFVPNSYVNAEGKTAYIDPKLDPEEEWKKVTIARKNQEETKGEDEVSDKLLTAIFGNFLDEDYSDEEKEEILAEKEGDKEDWIKRFKKKQLQNEMIEQTLKVLEHPNSTKSLLSPNSADELKELAKGLGKKLKLFEMFMPKTLVNLTYQMFSSKALVGIFASQSTHHSLAQQVGLHFKTSRPFYFDHNTIIVDGKAQPSLAGVTTKTTYKIISDRLGNQYISASVDAAKDPFLFYLGCNLDTGGIFALVERLGGDIEYLVKLIKQPIIQDYLLAMSNNNQLGTSFTKNKKSVIKDVLKIYKAEQDDSEFLVDYYNNSSEKSVKLNALKFHRDLADRKPSPSMMLDDFLYLSEAARVITNSIGTTKFDTNGPGKDIVQSVLLNENYNAFNKEMQSNEGFTLATAKDGKQLPYSRLVTDTILDVFYKKSATFTISLYNKLVALNSNYEFNSVLKDFNNPLSPYVTKKLTEEDAQKLYGAMINFAIQQNIDLNKNLFFGNKTLAREILNIQKNPDHPLYNNYVITNVFNPEISDGLNSPDILTILNKNIESREKNYILKAFAEIKNVDPVLYDKLLTANYFQSGVMESPASYYSLLPYNDVFSQANSLLKNHADTTSGKKIALMDALMANLGTSLNNIKYVSYLKTDIISKYMIFDNERTNNKEYIKYEGSIYKKIGENRYIALDRQSYKNMFYNLKTNETLNYGKQESIEENVVTQESDVTETPVKDTFKTTNDPANYTNYSGGAYGGDTFWDIIGREFDVNNHMHYKDAGNPNLSQKLKNAGVKATILTKEQMDKARTEVERLLGKKYPDTLEGNLQVRNYYQVANSDAVFAIATLNSNQTGVSGGTNTAIQLGISLNKPVYVWDVNSEQWYKFDEISQHFEKTETPILTKDFAGIGTRDIENYSVPDKNNSNKWISRKEYVGDQKSEAAKQAIRDVYSNTFKSTQLQTSVTEAAPVLNNKLELGRYVKFNNETFIVTKINANDTVQIYNPTLEGAAAKKSVAMRNLELLNSKAEIVDHKGNSYIVTPKETIISLTTNKAMNWGEENGDRKEILYRSKNKISTQYSAWNNITENNKKNLSKVGITEEIFNNSTAEEQNKLIKCHG